MNPHSIVGVWSTASRRQVRLNRTGGRAPFEGGAWVQVSRLGMPLVNELVIARQDKDKWNQSKPSDDAQFLSYVQNPELAGIINALFPSVLVPANPRSDLVTVFLTGVPGVNQKGVANETLRLNMATPVSASPAPHGPPRRPARRLPQRPAPGRRRRRHRAAGRRGAPRARLRVQPRRRVGPRRSATRSAPTTSPSSPPSPTSPRPTTA